MGSATWGDTLVMSDGSENIYFLNPKDFSQIDRLQSTIKLTKSIF